MTHQTVNVEHDDVAHIAHLIERVLEQNGISVGMGMLGAGLVAGRLGSPQRPTVEEEVRFINDFSHYVAAYWTPNTDTD